jgi:hypothetical protein
MRIANFALSLLAEVSKQEKNASRRFSPELKSWANQIFRLLPQIRVLHL